jgi:hypothetical protein
MAFSLNLFYQLRQKAIVDAVRQGGLLFEDNENLREFLYPFWAGMAVDILEQSGCPLKQCAEFCLLPRPQKIALFKKRAIGGFEEFINAFNGARRALLVPAGMPA